MSTSSGTYDEPSTSTQQTSTSSSNNSTTSGTGSSNGLSTGRAAGLAIGCLFAGVIITALITALLLARRKRKSTAPTRPQRRSSTAEDGVDKRFSSTVMRHVSKSSPNPAFEALLAKPLPEDELVALYARLRGLISDHANGYLGDQNRSFVRRPDPSFIQRLEALVGPQSIIPALRLATMLLDRRTQTGGLRYLFAWTILENVKSSGAPETTLLPPEISECMSSMAGLSNDNKARTILLSRWRQVCRVLMEPTYGRTFDVNENDPRQINIRDLANALHETLHHLLGEDRDEQQLRELKWVISEGAIFGYILFTQPSEWTFDWTRSTHNQSADIVVFPALLKTSDETGRILPVPEMRETMTLSAGANQ